MLGVFQTRFLVLLWWVFPINFIYIYLLDATVLTCFKILAAQESHKTRHVSPQCTKPQATGHTSFARHAPVEDWEIWGINGERSERKCCAGCAVASLLRSHITPTAGEYVCLCVWLFSWGIWQYYKWFWTTSITTGKSHPSCASSFILHHLI